MKQLKYPLPDVDAPDFVEFWNGCASGKLVLPVCVQGHFVWPPRPKCLKCQEGIASWAEVEQSGRVYSWTVVHRSSLFEFSDSKPFAVVIVELPMVQIVRMVGLWQGEIEDLFIGCEAHLIFERVNDEVALPQWRPTKLNDRPTKRE
jgi:uncharacterized OB-fold protein